MEPRDVGKTFAEKYEALILLGRGAQGCVYEARVLATDERVAIKVANPSEPDFTRFKQESDLLRGLSHRNIVRWIGWEVGPKYGLMVMELLYGETLGKRLSRRPHLTYAEISNYMLQICAGVEVLHTDGIIHRDLKPDNIFLHSEDKEVTVKLLDLGVAKDTNAALCTVLGQQPIGTPGYFPPDPSESRHPTRDIYSLGNILYHMITGERAVQGGPDEALQNSAEGNIVPPSQVGTRQLVPAEMDALILSCLSRSEILRPQSVSDFVRQLGTVLWLIDPALKPVHAPAPAPAKVASGDDLLGERRRGLVDPALKPVHAPAKMDNEDDLPGGLGIAARIGLLTLIGAVGVGVGSIGTKTLERQTRVVDLPPETPSARPTVSVKPTAVVPAPELVCLAPEPPRTIESPDGRSSDGPSQRNLALGEPTTQTATEATSGAKAKKAKAKKAKAKKAKKQPVTVRHTFLSNPGEEMMIDEDRSLGITKTTRDVVSGMHIIWVRKATDLIPSRAGQSLRHRNIMFGDQAITVDTRKW